MCFILTEKKVMHIHPSDLYGRSKHKNPFPGGMKFTHVRRPFPGHHYYIHSFCELYPGVEMTMS